MSLGSCLIAYIILHHKKSENILRYRNISTTEGVQTSFRKSIGGSRLVALRAISTEAVKEQDVL